MHSLLIVPTSETAEFFKLPPDVRQEAEAWMRALSGVFTAAKGEQKKAMVGAAKSLGCSWKTVRRKYDEFRKTQTWRVLVNWAKVGRSREGVSAEIVELFKTYCENNQRKCAPAWRILMRDYHAGKLSHIQWPVLEPGCDYPTGCSYENLMRLADSTKHELIATRIGRTASALVRPLVYTTRRDLWVGSHYMFDDMWHDFFINTFAEKQAGRPLELFSHDLFSGRKLQWGIRVRTRQDDGKMAGLAEKMTRMILASTLYNNGYSPRGTVIVAEHGTAAINARLEEAMSRCTGGLITVARSGMTGAAAHAGQYPGLGKGNFRFKASLESSNNLTHNEFASLPGQTGKDVANRPEGLSKQLSHNAALMAAYSQLPPEQAELLEFDLLEQNQFMHVASAIYRNIENYTDHDLEGWVEAGLVVNEILFGGVWMHQGILKTLPEGERAGVLALIGSGGIQSRVRKMSRLEAYNTGGKSLVKAPGFLMCEILGDDLAAERKVRNSLIEFEDAEVGPGVHRYHNIAEDTDGRQTVLREGETYQMFVNPFAPDALFARDARGCYLGECERINPVSRADIEALHRACGAAAKREGEILRPVQARHTAEAREKMRRALHNADVVVGRPVTPEQQLQAKEEKNLAELAEAALTELDESGY